MTLAQSRELGAALVRNMPDLTVEQAQAWVDDPVALKAFLARMNFPQEEAAEMPFRNPEAKPASKKPARIPLPVDGKLFQLTLDASKAEPMAMVRGDSYDPKEWKFNGTPLTGTLSGQFKLVRLGALSDLRDARAKAHAMKCDLAEGQWREAFKVAYPHNDGEGPVAFGGESTEWVDPHGDRRFPVLYERGESWNSCFRWAGRGYGGPWRWLAHEQGK